MLAVREEHGGSVICLMQVPRETISLYGCPAVTPTSREDVVVVTDLVEKPDVADAPSDYAVIGRYVLDPAVFDEPGLSLVWYTPSEIDWDFDPRTAQCVVESDSALGLTRSWLAEPAGPAETAGAAA